MEVHSQPLPSMSLNAEGALACGKCVHRRGTPAGEIKVAESGCGRFLAPWIWICIMTIALAVRRAVCCALPLGFGGQRLPCPARVSFRLRLTHVDWPIERQTECRRTSCDTAIDFRRASRKPDEKFLAADFQFQSACCHRRPRRRGFRSRLPSMNSRYCGSSPCTGRWQMPVRRRYGLRTRYPSQTIRPSAGDRV